MNLVLICVVGAGLYMLKAKIVKSIVPAPKIPTAKDVYNEFCQGSPWLCAPPQVLSGIQQAEPSKQAERLEANVTSEVVARIYTRGMMEYSGKHFSPSLQELFYDWVLTLSSNYRASGLSVIIKSPVAHDEDRVSVTPESIIESVSEEEGRWMSGFKEPGRKPDFYERLIRLRTLEKGENARIVIRRPFMWQAPNTQIPPIDFARSFRIEPNVSLLTKAYDPTQHASEFVYQLNTLGNWKWSGLNNPPLPIRSNPDIPTEPLRPNEFETTVEARCKDAKCSQVTVRQLEVRTQR
jgi:hypothetical protein